MQKLLSTPLWSLLLLIAGIGWNASEAQAQAIQFSYIFDGLVLTGTSSQPGATANNATYGAGLGAKTFFAGNPGDAVAGDGFASGTPLNPANNDYFGFSFTAGPCFAVTLTSLSFDARRSGTGPANLEIRSSADGFTTTLFAGTLSSTNFESKSGALANLLIAGGQTMEFRIYGFNATGGTGTARVDNVKFNGTIAASVPSAFSVTGGGAICPPVGTSVGLSGSQTNVNYQLYFNNSPIGGTLAGTGNALNFGDQTGLGNYTVVATNTNGCTTSQTGSVTITQSGNCGGGGCAITLTSTQVNVLCNGASTGSIDLTASGGTAPYTYAWTGGATTEDRANLAAGTYTVTVTDATACSKTLSATITQSSAIVLTETHLNVLCNGASTGSIDLTVSGGSSPYTYNWGGGITTQDRSNLAAATYTVTVTDANACTKTTSVAITEATAIQLTETHANASCGNPNGSIDLSVSGGTSPYTYFWTGGVTTQDRSNLAAGTYTVTVTDANTCTKTTVISISETSSIGLTETQVNVSCNGGSTGSIDLTVTGGLAPYTYFWTGGVTTQDRSNLSAGTYNVTVTDANACTKISSVTITEPAAIVLSTTQVNVLCNGNSTGSIDLTVTNGVSPYSYSWTGGVTTQDRSGLAVGTYTVTVTDANTCTKTTSVTITQPAALSLSSTVVIPSNCFVADGSIDLSVSGGVAGYTYDWSNDGPEAIDNDPQDLLNLVEGTYTVTVTDANGCSTTHAKTLDYIDIVNPSITCPGNTTVAADNSCSSPIGSYSPASLSDNCTANPTVVQSPVSSTLVNLANPSRLVTLTATDEAGNTKTCNFTVSLVDITKPSISCPANAIVIADAGCSGTVGSWNAVSANDNCGGNPSVTQSPVASTPLFGHNDVKTITLTATDASNNTATCAFTVTLKDQTKPNISCPANITINANENCNSAIGSYSPTSLSDNCTANPTVVQSPLPSTLLNGHNSSVIVTLTASDAAANTQSCTFTVTLKDVTPPSIVCKGFVAILDANGNASINPADVYQAGSDNCGVVNLVSVVANTFACNNIGPNLVILTANDGNGNTATCSATVLVRDVTPPVAKCKDITANLGVNGIVTILPAMVNNGTTDNCSFSLSVTLGSFNCANIGINTVTLRATDAGGNTATCTANVKVSDLTAPNAKCKNPTIFVNDAGQATLSTAQVNNGSTDACGIATMSINETQFNCSNIPGSSWPVTLSLTDVNGNASSCLSNVTVKDAMAPTAVCENVTVSLNVYGIATVYGDDLAFNSFDNCSVWSYLPVAKVYTASNLGPNNLPVIVKDWSGNAATCISVVTVLPYGSNRPSGNGRNEQKGLLTDAAFKVYPNPTTGDVTLAFNLSAEQPVKIRVYDLQGRMQLSSETLGQEGDNILPLHLEGFAAGLYLLDFQTEEFKTQKRLMVQE